MKGYGLILLLMAILLLLLPLPALPRGTAAGTAPVVSDSIPDSVSTTTTTADRTTATDDSVSSEPSSEEGIFRLLCGEEVVTLTERDFLIRTLAMEMAPSYHTEALKAQTVAAYTYYSRRRQAQKTEPDPALLGADFVTPNEQFPASYTQEKLKERWGDQYDANYQKIAGAVEAVLGKTITHEGALIDACYHAISSGCTEAAAVVWGADIPYLQATASPGDRLAPGYEAVCTFTPDQIRTALDAVQPALTLPEDPAAWFGEPTLSAAGYVESQPIGDVTLPGTRVRQLLGLRSAAFSVAYKDGIFTFTVCGYGHGVGMSQYGADYLARQGYAWEEILHYYYADTQIG